MFGKVSSVSGKGGEEEKGEWGTLGVVMGMLCGGVVLEVWCFAGGVVCSAVGVGRGEELCVVMVVGLRGDALRGDVLRGDVVEGLLWDELG